jgi:hypothetical protein
MCRGFNFSFFIWISVPSLTVGAWKILFREFIRVGDIHKGRGGNAEHVLMQARKPGFMNKIAEALTGAVMDVIFDTGYADIKDEETNGIIAVAVDENEPAVAIEHAKHFAYRPVLVGIMMEGIAAGNYVKAVIVKW